MRRIYNWLGGDGSGEHRNWLARRASGAVLDADRSADVVLPKYAPARACHTFSLTIMPGSVDSLDSTVSSEGSDYYDDEDARLAEEEWQESLVQLQQLVSFVLLPYLGKFLGRRWSHWGT